MNCRFRRWFTCTPVRFVGDHTFFARDSGLLCKGFQEIGIECKAIMPGPPMEADQTEDLIRTDYRNLEDPEWWRSLGGEGVVFYGWGSGKYVRIVRAIKQAGLFLVTHMDTAGMLGVFNGFGEFAGTLWRMSMGETRHPLLGALRFAAKLAYGCSAAIMLNDFTRARHLKLADIIGAITPIALDRIRKVCRVYGGEELAGRVLLVPHPNASYMTLDPATPKERLVVAVGRWDDAKVKGTDLLMEVCGLCTERDAALVFEIYGRPSQSMLEWHGSLPSDRRDRVRLKGVVPNTGIMKAYQRARISLCTSLREGYHTASAEAHCCGCSVVGPDVPEIPSMKWFASGAFGRMAERTAAAISGAVIDEMALWDSNQRNALEISNYWSGTLHSPRIAEQIASLMHENRSVVSISTP